MRAGFAWIVALTLGCASHHAANAGADGGPGTRGDAGPILGGTDAGSNQDGCTDATRLVYVVSHEGGLYSFYPPTLDFKLIGVVACPTGGASPFSMAVDRSGTAWVLFSDGTVWKVSTKDASCAATSYAQDQLNFHTFGMGFATESAASANETLYIDDLDGKGLATVSIQSLLAKAVGPFDGALQGRNGELTGTGEGRLFGFFTTLPAQVAEINKATGSILNSATLDNVSTGTDWAFSFWGGDFYLYTAHPNGGLPMNGTGSDVTRYRPADKSVTVVKQNVGFRIVGAGVSTCAPITLPPAK
jgi:hypothetical protein